MKFLDTKFKGVFLFELEKYEDERGFFARKYCEKQFSDLGLHASYVQTNVSFNVNKGTIRGMHYQQEPFGEVKIVTCYAGEIFDVIIDLRKNSSTYCHWQAFYLSSKELKSLYVPKGFAHGFQTLKDQALVHYKMGEFYQPDYARGIRWNDPHFNISWPINVTAISEKDQNYKDFIQ